MRAGAVHEREFAQVEHHPPRTATANRAACAPAAESSPGPGRRLPAPRSRPDQRSCMSRRRPAARYPRGRRSNQRAARSTSRPPGLVDPRKSGRARPPLWADLTMDALQPPRYSARQTDQRHCSAAEQPPALGDPAVSTRSVSARMNTPHTMCPDAAGCRSCSRSPASGRTSEHRLEAPAHHLLKLHPLLEHGRTAAAPQQRLLHAPEAPRSRHVTTSSSS
jgi:hypothetical protein